MAVRTCWRWASAALTGGRRRCAQRPTASTRWYIASSSTAFSPASAACSSFLPIIVTLFFFLSILEDTGYMARVAFVMDKLLRKIGLSGRSIVPMLIGFGCPVPAVMATRTVCRPTATAR
ncbi:MAG: nucleoside recognition domain-containing protein [Oscillospiraceae bacterium]